MSECEFCGDEIEGEDSVACQYCDGIFCTSMCFDSHLVGFPMCGGTPPNKIVDQARERIFGEHGWKVTNESK